MGTYVAAVEALRGKKKDRMKLSELPKLVEKLVWFPVISFWKTFIPSYAFDALIFQNWLSSPPNRLTLQKSAIVLGITYCIVKIMNLETSAFMDE